MTRAMASLTVSLSAIALTTSLLDAQFTAQGQSGSQAPVFRSMTSGVAVDVSVRDKSRKSIGGLVAADFVVTDNGVRQDVAEVSYGTRPIDVTIGLDVSTSVTGPVLESLRRAVLQLMGDLRKDDRLKLLLFNNEVHRAADFTTDVSAVDAAMRHVSAGGGTSLYDAISVALVGAADANRRQLIMFFTDGVDSGSTISTALLQTVAERARATLTFVVPTSAPTVNFGSGPVSLGPSAAPSVAPALGRLATETGGTVLPTADSTTLTSVFRRILDEFRSTYVLFYSPNGVDRTGYHTIGVDVARPGAVVQARRGYFGG
jgi:VWFA-related protein